MEIFKSMTCAYIAYVSLVIFLSHRLNIGMEISWIMECIYIHINSKYFPVVSDNGTYLCPHKFQILFVYFSVVPDNGTYICPHKFFSHLHISIYVQHDDLKYTSYNPIIYTMWQVEKCLFLFFFYFTIFITHTYCSIVLHPLYLYSLLVANLFHVPCSGLHRC